MEMRADDAPVAVSLTTTPLDGDSRALRIAHSLAETGFRSIVVEARPSARGSWGSAIEVISLSGADRRAGAGFRGGPVAAMRRGRLGRAGEAVLAAAFRAHHLWQYRWLPRARIPPAQLYYLHSFELHRAVMPLAARLGAPIVYDAHDFYRGIEPPERLPRFDREQMRPFLDRLEDRLVGAAAAVVTVSGGVAQLIERTFGRRPAVIRNCHDPRLDRPVARDLRARLGLGPECRLAVVVGNCKPGMAIETAADALALLPEPFHIAFLGRGYERAAASLAAHPAAARLHFGEHQRADQVVPSIRSADLGLVIYRPRSENYRNALPNGFFQTVAAGLPLVRAPLPEIEAAIGGRRVGACLASFDASELASAIMRCGDDPIPLRQEAAGLAQSLRWEDEARHLHRLIDRVLATRAGRQYRAARPSGAAVIPPLAEKG